MEDEKSDDNAVLILVERKTRNYYAILLDNQDHESVGYAINQLQQDFGELFPKVFKTIASDNGSDFSNLALGLKDNTDVYFAHPYASYERGSNE